MQNISGNEKAASDLFNLLVELGRVRAMRDPMQMLVAEQELTTPQLHTLSWLAIDGALTMGELARRLGITEKTITGVIDRLERDRLVQRVRDSADRRVVRAHLTGVGKRQAEKLVDTARHSMAAFLSMLDDEDRASLLRIIQKVVTRVASMSSETSKEKDVRK
jgi:DNA-binding MarR family transcriptional regulator